MLGAGTLRDISLALFIGIIVGTYSTIFIASPMYAHLRENEPKIKQADSKKQAAAAKRAAVETRRGLSTVEEITTDQALTRIAAGARLYDVREQGSGTRSTLPGGPAATVRVRGPLDGDRTRRPAAIVVCHSGMRSARAVQALEQQGVPAVNSPAAWSRGKPRPARRPTGSPDAEGETRSRALTRRA